MHVLIQLRRKLFRDTQRFTTTTQCRKQCCIRSLCLVMEHQRMRNETNGTVQQSSTHEQLMHSLARSYTLANRVRRGVVSRGRKSSRKDEAVLLSCDIIGARYSLVCDIYYPCCSFDILLVHCFAGSTSAGRPTAHVERYTSIPPPTAFQQQL